MYLYENNVVFFVILVEMIITVLFLAMQQWGYSKMLRECEKGAENNLVVKNIRERKVNVNSVDNFVNKYVNNFEFGGLKLYTIKKICGQLLNFVFITWAIVSIYGVYLEVSIKDLLWTTMLGILIVGGLFTIGHSVDNLKYEHIAKVNLKNNIEEYIYFNDEGMGISEEYMACKKDNGASGEGDNDDNSKIEHASGELMLAVNNSVGLNDIYNNGEVYNIESNKVEGVNEIYSGNVEESIPRVEGEEIITTVGEIWKKDVFNTNSWDDEKIPSVAEVYGTEDRINNRVVYESTAKKSMGTIYEEKGRRMVRTDNRDIDEAIAETRRRRESKDKDIKLDVTPEEKRMKLRKAVFATDRNPARGNYVVELNSDNLGYLSDYQ